VELSSLLLHFKTTGFLTFFKLSQPVWLSTFFKIYVCVFARVCVCVCVYAPVFRRKTKKCIPVWNDMKVSK